MDTAQGNLFKNNSPFLSTRFRHWIGGIVVEMKRVSPVQQWVESVQPTREGEGEDKPLKRVTSDISITEDTQDVDALSTDLEGVEITKESVVPCGSQESQTKDVSVENDVNNKLIKDSNNEVKHNSDSNGTIVKSKSDYSVKVKNGDIVNNGSVDRSPQSEDGEQRDRMYLYSKSVDCGVLAEKNERTKAPLVRDRSYNSEGNSPKHKYPLRRDSSLQSDNSRASSVESLLEARKIDAEAVLRGVGFGPSPSKQQIARIPDRFLRPSQLKGVSTEQFIKDEQRSMKLHDCGVFGYRGLTGDPNSPTSQIVTKIIESIVSKQEEMSPEQMDPMLAPMLRPRRNTNSY